MPVEVPEVGDRGHRWQSKGVRRVQASPWRAAAETPGRRVSRYGTSRGWPCTRRWRRGPGECSAHGARDAVEVRIEKNVASSGVK